MTKKNEQNGSHTPGGGGGRPTSNGSVPSTTVSPATTTATTTTTTSTGVMIVQQQTIGEQQHYVLPAVNNPAPMIFTTPLGMTSDNSLPLTPLPFSCAIDHHSSTPDNIEFNNDFRSNGESTCCNSWHSNDVTRSNVQRNGGDDDGSSSSSGSSSEGKQRNNEQRLRTRSTRLQSMQ